MKIFIEGEIWADVDDHFIVDENGEVLLLNLDVTVEPSNTWAKEAKIRYEAWDADEGPNE